jgi:hypothetical protein
MYLLPIGGPSLDHSRRTSSRRQHFRVGQLPPSEPILFPKLRIHHADFLHLSCSIIERLHTLETRCGYWYDMFCSVERTTFHGQAKREKNPQVGIFCQCTFPTSVNLYSESITVNMHSHRILSLILARCDVSCHHKLQTCSRILTGSSIGTEARMPVTAVCCALASTNPYSTEVDMEPFPTSDCNDCSYVIATSTKICTDLTSTQLHSYASTVRPRLPTRQYFFAVCRC